MQGSSMKIQEIVDGLMETPAKLQATNATTPHKTWKYPTRRETRPQNFQTINIHDFLPYDQNKIDWYIQVIRNVEKVQH